MVLFQLDSVPSNQGTMRGTNSVGPVHLDHFPKDPGVTTMTGCWFGICVTSNLDCLCSAPIDLS